MLSNKRVTEKVKQTSAEKLQKIELEVTSHNATIDELTTGAKQFVTISVPVNQNNKFKDLPQNEVNAIIKASNAQVDPASSETFQKLKKQITTLSNTLNATSRRVNTLIKGVPAENLKPQHINIALNAKDYHLTVSLAQKMLDNLTKNFNENNISLPLSKDQENRINSIMELHSILTAQKQNALISNFAEAIQKKVDINKLSAYLEKHEQLTNILLLDSDKSKSSALSAHLKESEARFVQLFQKLTINEINTDSQKAFLATMLERAIGNKSFNSKLTAFSQEKGNISYAKYQYAVGDIKYFSYKTRHFDKINDINKKCIRNLELLNSGQKVNEFEKLSQFEFGVLCDIAKMKKQLDEYNEQGVIPETGKLRDLYNQSKQASELVKEINERAVAEERYKAGDILMVHSKKSIASKDKKADQETVLTHTFISKYGHAAQMFIDPDNGKPSISHIYGGHQVDKVQGQDIATGEIFRIDPTKLVSKETAETLNKLYAAEEKDWKVEVTKMYQEILQDLHENSQQRFENIKNDKSARFKAGLANFGLYGGHTTSSQDFEDVHETMFGLNDRSTKEKMICSEFVARSTVASFVELNNKLNQKLEEYNIQRSGHDLVKVPIAKNENLERVHPERLINLLDKAGCLIEVPRDSVISELVSQEKLQNYTKSKDVAKDLYMKMETLANQSRSQEEFVEYGKKIFEAYIKSENIISKVNPKEAVLEHLDKSLKSFYHEYDKRNPKTFGGKFKQLLNNFAEWIGVKDNQAKNIIKNTVKYIEEGIEKQDKKKESKYTKILKDNPHLIKGPELGNSSKIKGNVKDPKLKSSGLAL